MNKIIIGCDPDSKKSGFSVYRNGKLYWLFCKTLLETIELFKSQVKLKSFDCVELHIENVAGTSTAFTAKNAKTLPAKLKIAQNIGQCKQVQIEIERVAESFGITVVHHALSSKWKKERAVFEKTTNWKGQSNEDSRSAAYFGYIGVLRSNNA